ANLRESAGDDEQAEAINRRALAAVERTGQNGTLLEATLLNNVANILYGRNDYAAAEPLFARSLRIGEAVLGGDRPFVATAVQDLGIMARQREDYATAIDDYGPGLSIPRRLLRARPPNRARGP